MIYPKESFSRLSQASVASSLKQLVKNNKGSEATLKGQILALSKNRQRIINIKVFTPTKVSHQPISETRR